MSFSVLPSPAVSFIGRKNSGKTTLLEKVIAYLSEKGLRIATIKHHGHPDFDIDIPGRDSYRHRAAGAQSTTILSDVRFAQITELSTPRSCESAISQLSGYDLVLVEGFKQASLAHIELFRAENPRDIEAAAKLPDVWKTQVQNKSLGTTSTSVHQNALPVAVITDIPTVQANANQFQVPCFTFDDIELLASFLQDRFARPKLSVVVQAGGESKRMGVPKDTVSFLGKPLICHVLERVSSLADELIVTTNDPDRLQFLKKTYPAIRFVPDQLKTRGSIPGLYTALLCAHHDLVGIVACDMLDFPVALLAQEALLLRPCAHPDLGVVLPKSEQGIEPFAGVYRKELCCSKLEQFISEKGSSASLRMFLDELPCGYIDCTSPAKCARFGGSFLNANTPEDLITAKDILTISSEYLY